MTVLERLANGGSRVVRAWEGQPVVCVAGGPSLTTEQVESCRGRARVIVINDGYRLVPWADLLYFADGKWHEWHKGRAEYRQFTGEKCSLDCNPSARGDPDVHLLRQGVEAGLSTDPEVINTGRNGGHQAINIAFLAGGNPILLLGYDGHGRHWFGEHPDKTVPPFEAMKAFAKTIAPIADAHGVRIINCTPGSALDFFPIGNINDASLLSYP